MVEMSQGAWSEICLIAITKKGGSNYEYAALTETVAIDQGDKDIEVIPTVGGGRVVKFTPQAETALTFECYPLDIDAAGSTGVSQIFQGGAWDAVEPLIASASRMRDLFRIAMLWTEDTAATSGAGATAAIISYRYIVVNAYCTSCKPSFTDKVLKFTLTFKVAPFNRVGTAQIQEQSTDGSTILAALSAYDAVNFPEGGTSFTF